MANNPAVIFSKITLGYRGQTVLEGLDLSIPEGGVFGILGCIGAGKTRLLRLIAQLEQPQSGNITYSPALQNRPVSYIFQQDLLVPWLTVGENLRLCVRDPAARSRALSSWPICAQLGLDEIEHKKPFQLSGGMRKKVNFARGFINEDPLVLMDEPFGALDPAQKRDLHHGFLSAIDKAHTTVVLVTHDIREALLVCDQIAFLSSKTKNVGAPLVNPYRGRFEANELFAEPRYRELFQAALDFYDEERRAT